MANMINRSIYHGIKKFCPLGEVAEMLAGEYPLSVESVREKGVALKYKKSYAPDSIKDLVKKSLQQLAKDNLEEIRSKSFKGFEIKHIDDEFMHDCYSIVISRSSRIIYIDVDLSEEKNRGKKAI